MYKLSEEQIRKLNLFSYYCRGYGVEEVNITAFVNDCELEYIDNQARNKFGSPIELYDSIEESLTELLENSGALDEIGDCESSGNIIINIDCVEKTINLEGFYYVMTTDENYYEDELDEIDNEDVVKFFTSRKSDGFEFGRVGFEGSGDSGYIDERIRYNDGNEEACPEAVVNYLYNALENSIGGGWEINEGSQGTFEFNFKENKIQLNAGVNNEGEESTGSLFFSKF